MAMTILALIVALAFELVNGFHDTANAVATVIYTRSLKSSWAVVYSGLLNFIGVMAAGVGVAYSIVHLFPLDAMLPQGQVTHVAVVMIFAVLCAAIVWNVATWFVGIPVSTSHALVGAILGASMAFSLQHGVSIESGVAWGKARSVILALLFSPILGFVAAWLLIKLAAPFVDNKAGPSTSTDSPPPWPTRLLLIATCGGVSFAHGSNDGQKGMGLMMLILMALAPTSYCLDLHASQRVNQQAVEACVSAARQSPAPLSASLMASARIWENLDALPAEQRPELRKRTTEQVRALRQIPALAPQADVLEGRIEYVSIWVKLAVALALGIGTMIGWKRVVVTVGEKIGKSHLTYSEGASAQLVAAVTILLADRLNMPVSTTHVLSSGVAGSMAADGSGVQGKTLAQIGLAWVLTLPVCIVLGYGFMMVL
jgi:PiT family inorganic phosphate transporter